MVDYVVSVYDMYMEGSDRKALFRETHSRSDTARNSALRALINTRCKLGLQPYDDEYLTARREVFKWCRPTANEDRITVVPFRNYALVIQTREE